MKKITLFIFLFFSSQCLKAQDATIWFYRPSKAMFNMLGIQIKISNQRPFILKPGKTVKYTIHSSGRVIIDLSVYGQGSAFEEQWLIVEPGKEYFFEIDQNQIQPTRELEWLKKVENPQKETWSGILETSLEEDINYPILDK